MQRILITGTSRGIGLEFCRQITTRGDEVTAVCRKPTPALEALGVQVIEGIDVADQDDVARLAEELHGVELDAVINNAGILIPDTLEDVEFESLRRQFEVNSLGPLRVTRALLENMHAGSRVAIVTSLMGSMADNGSGGYYGYRMSKAAVNAAGVSLARDLVAREIPVMMMHPGMVATEMTGGRGIAVEESTRGMLERLDAATLSQSGCFWHSDGRQLKW